MKNVIISTLLVLFLTTALTSLEAGIRVRPSFGLQFGSAVAHPRPYVVHRYPVYAQPVRVYRQPVVMQEVYPYYEEAVVYPTPCYHSYSGFSFGLRFR